MNIKERLKDQKTSSAELHNHARRNIVWLIAGIGIGSTVALLLAPKEGEEVRRLIRRSCRKTLKSLGRRTEDLLDHAERLREHTSDLFDHALHLGRSRETVRHRAV